MKTYLDQRETDIDAQIFRTFKSSHQNAAEYIGSHCLLLLKDRLPGFARYPVPWLNGNAIYYSIPVSA